MREDDCLNLMAGFLQPTTGWLTWRIAYPRARVDRAVFFRVMMPSSPAAHDRQCGLGLRMRGVLTSVGMPSPVNTCIWSTWTAGAQIPQ